jgi:hypothetical protein
MDYQWDSHGILSCGKHQKIWEKTKGNGGFCSTLACLVARKAGQIIQKYGEIGGDCMGNSLKNGESLEKDVEKKSQKIVLKTQETHLRSGKGKIHHLGHTDFPAAVGKG